MERPSAQRFWDSEVVEPTHTSWMHDPLIHDYILRSIDEKGEGLWPIDWLERTMGGRRFERALSIGCGSGALERDIVRRGLVQRVDAFDGSTNSLRVAHKTAREEGLSARIRYYAADFNEPSLPRRTYDIVFIHQALHHVAKLEKLLRGVLLALKPGGLLYLDEYFGPSRHDWDDALIAPHRAAYDALPAAARRQPVLPLPIHPDDPSEAFRSGEMMEQLVIGFDIRTVRGYGGNLLSVLYPVVDPAATPIRDLIEEEKRILAAGQKPYYAVVLAYPKRHVGKLAASWRYFTEPKLKRVGREIRAWWEANIRSRTKP